MYSKEANVVWKRGLYYGGVPIAMGLMVVGFFLLTPSQPKGIEAVSAIPEMVTVYEGERVTPGLPARLLIPRLDVDAEVQHVGRAQTSNDEMAVPSNFTDVGWYKEGVRPGMQGSAVIAGHLSGKKVPEAVFYELHTLEIGDEVISVSDEGIEYVFQVRAVKTYAYDEAATDVFVSTDGKTKLNLITCGGAWLKDKKLYDKRTVVFTERVMDGE